MGKNKKRFYIVVLLVVLFIAAGYLIYVTYIKPISLVKRPVPVKELVTLYYYNPDTDTLEPEQREITATNDLLNKCRNIISELEKASHKGLVTPIPAGVRINDAMLQSNGVLLLDLNGELISKTPEGSSAEITAIYSIVNSLAKNIDGVKAVQITVNGKRIQTLETHIETDQPIVPDYSK
ncbi:MAG: GerMN domain-containing protein [bacterium]